MKISIVVASIIITYPIVFVLETVVHLSGIIHEFLGISISWITNVSFYINISFYL